MANNKSSKKRIKTTKRNNMQNRIYKSLIKTYTKKYFNSIKEYKNNPTEELLKDVQKAANNVYSKIDKALKKNVLHKNTAARKKSKIGIKLNGL